jgi:hypothetical protein
LTGGGDPHVPAAPVVVVRLKLAVWLLVRLLMLVNPEEQFGTPLIETE